MTMAISKGMINRPQPRRQWSLLNQLQHHLPHTLNLELTHLISTSKMSSKQIIRNPSHAGSWYTSSKSQLNSQLDGWLDDVKTPVTCIGPHTEGQQVDQLPVPGARIIIGP
jgi:hypothetical protein